MRIGGKPILRRRIVSISAISPAQSSRQFDQQPRHRFNGQRELKYGGARECREHHSAMPRC
jgi:hypothetical protein